MATAGSSFTIVMNGMQCAHCGISAILASFTNVKTRLSSLSKLAKLRNLAIPCVECRTPATVDDVADLPDVIPVGSSLWGSCGTELGGYINNPLLNTRLTADKQISQTGRKLCTCVSR